MGMSSRGGIALPFPTFDILPLKQIPTIGTHLAYESLCFAYRPECLLTIRTKATFVISGVACTL